MPERLTDEDLQRLIVQTIDEQHKRIAKLKGERAELRSCCATCIKRLLARKRIAELEERCTQTSSCSILLRSGLR